MLPSKMIQIGRPPGIRFNFIDSDKNAPYTQWCKAAKSYLIQIICFMYVQDKPGKVTDEEDDNNGDEDDAETLLLLLVSSSQFLDGEVDLDIEQGDNRERDDSQDKQS